MSDVSMNGCAIVIFGATGDLAKRKLIPALYRLLVAKKLDNFVILGAALGDASVDDIMAQAQGYIGNRDESVWQRLKERFYYQSLNFTQSDDYDALHAKLQELEQRYNLAGNRLVYLSCAAHFFSDISRYCAQAHIAVRTGVGARPWHRLVYEKPFGRDRASAHRINESLACFFDEHQIYRIDHYLTKELVSNITLMRFTNCFFEPLWNNAHIEHVQIILSEQIGIEGRGLYYDEYGALCDVVQNHVLELLALIAMEPPYKLTGDYVREQRARVLEKVRMIGGFLGQYEGYLEHPGVRQNSETETFAMLSLRVDAPRWQGVPFYIKTGKRLRNKETMIAIKFKQINSLLVREGPIESNWLTMRIVPDATFALRLNLKKPGRADELTPATMEFCHSCIFGERTPEEAYEILLEEVMRGEQAIAVRFDEIEYAWRVIDEIRACALPLYSYKQSSQGPEEIKEFEKTYDMEWLL